MRLKKSFWRLESLCADSDFPSIGERVFFHKRRRFLRKSVFLLDIVRDVAELFFDFTNCIEIGRVIEGISTKKQKFDEVFCDVSSSNIEPLGDVLEAEAFVDMPSITLPISIQFVKSKKSSATSRTMSSKKTDLRKKRRRLWKNTRSPMDGQPQSAQSDTRRQKLYFNLI
jgi:hypothetical protein